MGRGFESHRGHLEESQMTCNEPFGFFVILNFNHQALSSVGEAVPSRRHNQSDRESGKEADEADTEEVPVPSSFFCSYYFEIFDYL